MRELPVVALLLIILHYPLGAQNLLEFKSVLFTGSGNCSSCHSPGGGSLTSSLGQDVSPPTSWRSSMMANSSKDPLWRAKMKAEIAVHPSIQQTIEHKCGTCHIPMGHTESYYSGDSAYALSVVLEDPKGRDGISCTVCHQIRDENLGTQTSYSGKYTISSAHEIFGPYTKPQADIMAMRIGYTPLYAEHVAKSELCATCHTLYTPYVDSLGVLGGKFPEQMPYMEWKNSIFPGEGKTCQSCHMPELDEAMKISNTPPSFATTRQPVWKHDFVGANIMVPSILRNNPVETRVTAGSSHFDSTRAKALSMLQDKSIELGAQASVVGDTVKLDVSLKNLAGHKFPTAYPGRRAWLRVKVFNSQEETVFESGSWNENFELLDLDEGYEPHHDYISSPEQVQVYQPVMADDRNRVTYTLLKAARYLKDNRLPPQGFTSQAQEYEDIAVMGSAAADGDFNRDSQGNQGTGSDVVHYRVPVEPGQGPFSAIVEVYYQSLTPRFVADLFAKNLEETNRFKTYYEAQGNSPVLVKALSISAAAGPDYTVYDLNGDQKLNIFDLLEMLKVLGGKKTDPESVSKADVNGNGKTDIFDLLDMLRVLTRR